MNGPGRTIRTQALVIGSGAGGAITAAVLAEAGFDVLLAEEGPDVDPSSLVSNSPEAIARLYRHGGTTPFLGSPNIAFVEGRCVGGSTEVNSGFWRRIPSDCYPRWTADALLESFSEELMEPRFEAIERELGVTSPDAEAMPREDSMIIRGSERLGWRNEPIQRCLTEPLGDAFAPGAKQSMQRTYVPRARRAGVQVLSGCRVLRLLHRGAGAMGARAVQSSGARGGREDPLTIRADFVFVCGGAIQTPALLRRSGIRRHVGDNLCIHPMLKVAALFDRDMSVDQMPLPLQVTEFKPTITIGASIFTPGLLAMLLADTWPRHRDLMKEWRRTAIYYTATRGLSRGTIRAVPGTRDGVIVRYRLTEADRRALSIGLAHTVELLFAAGARAVYPAVRSLPVLTSPNASRRLLDNPLPAKDLSLSTVHAFSSCPMGENPDFCATDSFGRVQGFTNLYVNDASLIPDSPGVNPQGTTMAIALRNAEHFLERARSRQVAPRRRGTRQPPRVLVTGAPGWLGTRLVELLASDGAYTEPGAIRCLVARDVDPVALPVSENVALAPGDLRDPESLAEFCRGADGAVLFHGAGLIHPAWRTRDFDEVNVEGTRQLLEAAGRTGVARVVAVSSNSPLGANPNPDESFDEDSPLRPYLGYGRSKAAMEALVRGAHSTGGLETTIVRAPWFYGPHQPVRQSTFFRMIRTGRFPVLAGGDQRRSMVYVDNLCQGLRLAAASEGAAGRTYWIADAHPYTINEIVETVRSVLEDDFGIACAAGQVQLPGFVGDVAYGVDAILQSLGFYQQKIHVLGEMHRTIACSIDRAARELGYSPAFSLREGMAESVRWCLENGHAL